MSPPAENPRPAAYRPGRIALTAIAVLAAMALGLVAGSWQWNRYETRSDAVDAQAAAKGKPIADLEAIVAPGALGPGDAEWRTATVTGVLDPTSVVELRGRSVDNTASLQYLAWVHTQSGRTVLVNLGWQPRSGATAPTLPPGEVTVTGIVRAFEEDNGKPGTRVTPVQMNGIDGEVVQAYLMATSTCGANGCVEGLEPAPIPSLSLGPHLSYALQWWLLTAVAAPLGVWLTRRDALHERERAAVAASPQSQPPPPKRSKKRRLTDEEIEDAL
ncbi:SURF1 family protein [Demequina sp.]|uniref:SURF1 family protein n=1 Tax=Demequina sp. TaxID=2050685 RepID=UPI0025C0CB54|nr:SURF1 family protein [Demequina sp.]